MEEEKGLQIVYSRDLATLMSGEWSGCCAHMVCTAGSVDMVFGGKGMMLNRGDLLVTTRIDIITELRPGQEGCQVEMIIANGDFLSSQLSENNYSVRGSISLYSNPIIPLGEEGMEIICSDFRHIASRIGEYHKPLYRQIMGSLCLTMMLDIFNYHAIRDEAPTNTPQANSLMTRLVALLNEGHPRLHRDLTFYAELLHVSPKYLSNTIKRQTGQTVTELINRYTLPVLVGYLKDTSLTLSQICYEMNFSSVSYLSRFIKKHLGSSPSTIRRT